MSRASLDSGSNADKKSASENSWKRESNEGGEFVTVVYMRDILSAIILLTLLSIAIAILIFCSSRDCKGVLVMIEFVGFNGGFSCPKLGGIVVG